MPDSTFGSLPQDTQQMLAAQCNSPACHNARNAVVAARNNVITACTDRGHFASDRVFWAALATAFLAAAGTAAGVALTHPWPINLIAGIIAGVLAIVGAVFLALAQDANSKVMAADKALTMFEKMFGDAVADEESKCNIWCPPFDTTIASC